MDTELMEWAVIVRSREHARQLRTVSSISRLAVLDSRKLLRRIRLQEESRLDERPAFSDSFFATC